MGTDMKVSFDRIIDLADAVGLAADNTLLEANISYRLGRLGDFLKYPVKQYNRLRERKRKEIADKQAELKKQMKGATDDRKLELSMEVQKLNEEFQEFLQNLSEQEEVVKVPRFKLSDFIAKEERKTTSKVGKGDDERTIEVTIKSGQPLVPVRFFALMGELVEDDKSAMEYSSVVLSKGVEKEKEASVEA